MMTILLTLVTSAIRAATPLLLAALGGIASERSGVINIALEGIMLIGAWAAVYFSYLTGSALVGVLGALTVGMLMAALHGVASIRFKANQVVSGVAINLFAMGFTEFMLTLTWGPAGQTPSVAKVGNLGPFNLFVYIAFGLVIMMHLLLWRTSWGLRLRAVGEHPLAADTVGIKVLLMRYQGVILSGLLAGLAGASLSIGMLSRFSNGMTAGRGFIALAAMIFGKWNPIGTMWACLLFGVADALGVMVQILGVNLPNQFLQMTPYLITMLALAGWVGRSRAPGALGVPYDKAS